MALQIGVQAVLLLLLGGLLAVGADILKPLLLGLARDLAVLLVLGGGGDAVGVLLRRPVVIGFLLFIGGVGLLDAGHGAAGQSGDCRPYGEDSGIPPLHISCKVHTFQVPTILLRLVALGSAELNAFRFCWL